LSPNATLDDDFLKNLEIAYAVVDTQRGSLMNSGRLTQDSALDFDPHLAAAPDGTLWLAWQSSPQLAGLGEAAAPNQLHAAAWDGKQWSAVETVTDQLIGTLWWSLAARDRQTVLVAADGTPRTPTATVQRDITIYQRTAGGWTSGRQVTRASSPSFAPRAAFTPAGQPVVAWYGQQSILGLSGDLSAAPSTWFTTTVDSGAALGAGTLLAGPEGQMALVWPGATPSGPDVWLARYDPTTRAWTGPVPVFADNNVEADLSAAARADGSLVLGLSRLAATTERVTTADGSALDVPASAASASLVVAELPGVFHARVAPTAASSVPWAALLAVVLVGLILLVGTAGMVLVLRRALPKRTDPRQ